MFQPTMVIHSFIYIQVDPKRLENLLDIDQVKWIKCTYKYNYNYKRITMNMLLQFIEDKIKYWIYD
jgi:hypothetical protein